MTEINKEAYKQAEKELLEKRVNQGKKSEHYSRKHFLETIAANNEFCREYGISTSTNKCEETEIT